MIEETARVFCKVVEAFKDSIVAEINIPNGEILRELDGYLFKVLEKFNLTSVGSKFYCTITETCNGLNIEIEPYLEIKEICLEVKNMYAELGTILDEGYFENLTPEYSLEDIKAGNYDNFVNNVLKKSAII